MGKRSFLAVALLFLVLGVLIGFSLAMGLVGDSPWQEFWLRTARCCADG